MLSQLCAGAVLFASCSACEPEFVRLLLPAHAGRGRVLTIDWHARMILTTSLLCMPCPSLLGLLLQCSVWQGMCT